MSNPSKEKGNIDAVPIHHDAEPLNPNAVRTTAIATGLNMCIFLIASIYFEAIVKTAAQNKKTKSLTLFAGDSINTKMSADMKKDSTLAGALNAQEKSLLKAQHTATKKMAEKIIASGLYGKIPNKPKMQATAIRKSK